MLYDRGETLEIRHLILKPSYLVLIHLYYYLTDPLLVIKMIDI